MKKVLIGSLLLSSSAAVFAEGSPWLLNPGDTSVQLTYVDQEADEFWAGDRKNPTPGNGDVSLTTTFLSINHGLSDDLAVDLRTGYSESDTAVAPSESDLADTTLGLTWRIHDEFLSEGETPSFAVRVAATLAGDYETNTISAIGDGADGVEASLILGKVFGSSFALAGDLGYRYRSGDVDNEILFNMNASYFITPSLSTTLAYHLIDSQGDLDIGGPGFSPDRFDEVEEDSQSLELSVAYSFTPAFSVNLGYGTTIDGRNTVDNDVVIAGLGFSF